MKVKSPLEGPGGVFKKREQANALGKDVLLQKYLHTTRGNNNENAQEKEHQIYGRAMCHGRGWPGLTLFMLLLGALTIASITVVVSFPHLSGGNKEKAISKENMKPIVNPSNTERLTKHTEQPKNTKITKNISKSYKHFQNHTTVEDKNKDNDNNIMSEAEKYKNSDIQKISESEDYKEIAPSKQDVSLNSYITSSNFVVETDTTNTNSRSRFGSLKKPSRHPTVTSARFKDILTYYANDSVSIAITEPHSNEKLAKNVTLWKYKNINPRASLFSSIDLLLPQNTKNLTFSLSNRYESLKFYALIKDNEADVAEYDTGDLIIKHSKVTVKKYQESLVVEAKSILVKWLEESYELHIITYGSASDEPPVIVIQYKETIRRKSLGFNGRELSMKRLKDTTENLVKLAGNKREKRWTNNAANHDCCQLSSWKIQASQLGLDVVFPNEISINYCTGNCRLMDDNAKFSLNALLRAKFRILHNPDKVPAPRCIATNYHTPQILVRHENYIHLQKLPSLLITECGCR